MLKSRLFKEDSMINKFKKDLKGASDYELSLFYLVNILLCLRVCIYITSFFVEFKERFFFIDFPFWQLIAMFYCIGTICEEEEDINIWGMVSEAYFFSIILSLIACVFVISNLTAPANRYIEMPIHFFVICILDIVCFCLLRLNNKEFKERNELKKQVSKEDKTNVSYNELNFCDNQCYILSKKVEYDILAIFSGLSKEEQDILRPTLKKILDLFYISYDSDNFVITDHELFYSILDFSSDLNEAVRVYKQDKTLSDISYLEKLEQASREFFCNLNDKKQNERKIRLEKTIGKLKIALCKI